MLAHGVAPGPRGRRCLRGGREHPSQGRLLPFPPRRRGAGRFPFLGPVSSLQATSCCSVPWTLTGAPRPFSSVKGTETHPQPQGPRCQGGVSTPPRAGGPELYRMGTGMCVLAPEPFCVLNLSWVGAAHTDSHVRAFAHAVLPLGGTPRHPPFPTDLHRGLRIAGTVPVPGPQTLTQAGACGRGPGSGQVSALPPMPGLTPSFLGCFLYPHTSGQRVGPRRSGHLCWPAQHPIPLPRVRAPHFPEDLFIL